MAFTADRDTTSAVTSKGGNATRIATLPSNSTSSVVERLQHSINKLEGSIKDLQREVRFEQGPAPSLGQVGVKPQGFSPPVGVNPQGFSLPVPEKDDQSCKHDVCEIFSRPRMCPQAKSYGVKGGWSIDKDFLDPVTKRTYDLIIRKGPK